MPQACQKLGVHPASLDMDSVTGKVTFEEVRKNIDTGLADATQR